MSTGTRAFALLAVTFCACSSDSIEPKLEQALQTAEQLTSEGWLERSMFFAVFPQGTPRQYVSFLFSDMGAAESPPVQGSGEFGREEEESMGRTFMPVWPAGVGMSHTRPDPKMDMQIVWKWDDVRRTIILEAYLNAKSSPVAVRETPFPTYVRPSELARLAGESNRETGARMQSF